MAYPQVCGRVQLVAQASLPPSNPVVPTPGSGAAISTETTLQTTVNANLVNVLHIEGSV